MKKLIVIFLLAFCLTSAGQDFTSRFDAARMKERVIKLSSDEFEGRGPGTTGGMMAAQYIADQLKAAGVKPAIKGSYFQNVKLVGLKADPNTKLQITGKNGTDSYKFADDFVATAGAQAADVNVDADIVFVGYGIESDLYNWHDYSRPADQYKGKVLMILVNDPPATESEPDLFGGKALTYFGRWTYKYEEAARRGAAGVILVHTTESAGYGWNVVRTSNGNWRYEIARTAGDKTPFLQFKSWATFDTAKKILASAGQDIDELTAAAKRRGFKAVNTGLRAKLNLKSELKTFDSPNVVGTVTGNDSKLKSEYVVFSAHWDHLGIGNPDARGDKIYNGAYDNASGVAAVLGIADVLAKMPSKDRPKRSFMFLFPTAEEQGLLGAEYYSRNPLVPLAKTAANVNLDGVNFFGMVSDVMALGAERSSIINQIAEAAKERNISITPDAEPEQGFFFRSDHFPFAKVGVPSVNFQHGKNFSPSLTGEAAAFFEDYNAKYYHQTTDEFHDWWEIDAMVQESELALAIGIKIANATQIPRYKETDEFSSADKKRFRK
jgi:Zn-dependent M28 family amino/carboxypeptidase